MIERNSHHALAFLLVGIACLQLVLQFTLFTRGLTYVVSTLTIDDTYYYLQTAWNVNLLGYPTFDGIHATNGLQLLWFYVIVLLAKLVHTKAFLLYLSLALNFIANVICYLPIWKLGRLMGRRELTFLLAAYWTLETLGGAYWMGLENSIHALVFWFMLWQAAVFILRTERGERPNHLMLGLLLVLNVWIRIDAIVYSAAVYAGCLLATARSAGGLKALWRKEKGMLAGSALLGALALAPIPFAYYKMGGTMIPISALVKTTAENQGAASARGFLSAVALGFPGIFPSPLRTGLAKAAIGGLGLFVLFARAFAGRTRSGDGERAVQRALVAVFAGLLLYHLVIVLFDIPYYPYYRWYRSPLYIFWIVVIATGIDSLAGVGAMSLARAIRGASWLHKRRLSRAGLQGGIMSAFVLMVFIYGYGGYVNSMRRGQDDDVRGRFYEASSWVSENLPPEAVCAAWNAGILGYFAGQRVVNLDGLANDKYYYEKVIGGKVGLDTYLAENSVEYIIDYREPPRSVEREVVHTFDPDKYGTIVKVWKLAR
jgi:hypothetical protein